MSVSATQGGHKNSQSVHHRKLGLISSQLRHVSITGKPVKQQYRLHMSPQYGERRPTNGCDRFGSLGTPANFNGFASCLRYCSDIAQRRPTKLCTMFGRLLSWYTIYIYIFGGRQNSLYVQVLHSPIHWRR